MITMAEIKRGNWAFGEPSTDDVPAGSVISGGNFSQHTPDTLIMAGRSLTINGGNWINVRKDAAWTITGGNWVQIEFCANKNPHLVGHGLAAEVENCPHAEAHEIVVDSVLIDTVYVYTDEIL